MNCSHMIYNLFFPLEEKEDIIQSFHRKGEVNMVLYARDIDDLIFGDDNQGHLSTR